MLERIKYPIANVKLFNVHRHISESDLDVSKPIKEQRRHGVFVEVYNKPIIAKTGLDLVWGVGNHRISRAALTSSNLIIKMKNFITGQRVAVAYDCGIIGAHWADADPCFCVERRIKGRRDRRSKFNLEHNLTCQHHNISVESVLAECKMHESDPIVF